MGIRMFLESLIFARYKYKKYEKHLDDLRED